MKVRVDELTCNGYGLCAAGCPEVFDLDEDGTGFVVAEYADRVPDELVERVRTAVEHCPQQAIEVVDEGP